jgi:dihydrofolate reductase
MIYVQNLVTLDGYLEGGPWEIDWHNVDAEFFGMVDEMWKNLGHIVFGRKTYEGMYSYWTGAEALKNDGEMAARMTNTPKIVLSRTLKTAEWNNTTLVHDLTDLAKLKAKSEKDLVVFGSSDVCAALLEAGLMDEVRQIVNPILLGKGKPMFQGLQHRVKLKLLRTRTFANGNVMLVYQPEKR